jgi:hypothetical protein
MAKDWRHAVDTIPYLGHTGKNAQHMCNATCLAWKRLLYVLVRHFAQNSYNNKYTCMNAAKKAILVTESNPVYTVIPERMICQRLFEAKRNGIARVSTTSQ